MDAIDLQIKLMKRRGISNSIELEELRKNTPLASMKETFKRQIEGEEAYRVKVLRNVATFSKLSDEHILSAAQNMEELLLPKGAVIIQQDDVGDSFYVVQEGQVAVTRVSNTKDPNEVPRELVRLGANSYFGEIALLTQEPRTATVTICSATAKVLKMTKAKFDDVMASCNATLFNSGKELGKAVVEKVPLFHSLTANKKRLIVESMRPMNFKSNTYICRQGSKGNTFYIITEGSCKVTINAGQGAETDIAKLGPGDFFGEVALIEASNRRTANVISIQDVTCMTLSRADFNSLLANVHNTLVENSLVRSLQVRKKKETKAGRGGKRRLTALGDNNELNDLLVPDFIKKFIKSMVDSLYLSLYGRLFREIVIYPDVLEIYGDTARGVSVMCTSRETAVISIMNHVQAIGKIDPALRSPADNGLLFGVLNQKNNLKDKICKGWPSMQYRLLCRQIRVIKVKALSKIVEVGSIGTSAYLILRGSVRVFQNQTIEGSHRTCLRYEEDLYPGEMFAEAALGGIRSRLSTVQAITHCDLAVIEYKDVQDAHSETGGQKESVDDKFQFLQKSALVRHWDGIEVYRLANILQVQEITKGTVLIRKGEVATQLSFLKEGKIDVVVGLGAAQQQHIITTMKQYECFGESGILNSHISGVERTEKYAESCYAIAGSHVIILSLPEQYYTMIDQITMDRILVAFREKAIWRVSRLHTLKAESRNVKKLKRNMLKETARSEDTDGRTPLVPLVSLQRGTTAAVNILEDIPSLINGHVDPLLAISTCRNKKEVRSVQRSIKESHRPKSAIAVREVSTISHNHNPAYHRQSTGAHSPLPQVTSSESKMSRPQTSGMPTRVSSTTLPPRPKTSQDPTHQAPESHSLFGHAEGKETVMWKDASDEYLRHPTKLLLGSTRIPTPESYEAFLQRSPSKASKSASEIYFLKANITKS